MSLASNISWMALKAGNTKAGDQRRGLCNNLCQWWWTRESSKTSREGLTGKAFFAIDSASLERDR